MKIVNGFSAIILLCFASFHTVAALAADHSVTAPAQAGINQQIDVQFTGPPAQGDMLRFADAQGKIQGGHYVYVGNLKDNSGQLTVPEEPGSYQVVYVSGGEVVAASPIQIVPVTAGVTAPATAKANETIGVTFDGPQNKGDTIQVTTPAGEVVRGYYAYVGNATAGVVKLKLPVEPGAYQVGYFTGSTLIGASPISVEGVAASVSAPEVAKVNETIDVTFSGPMNSGDYLQFVDANGKAMSGLYQYVGNARDGAVRLTAPVEPGIYRIAYFTAKQDIGSTPVTVVGVEATLAMAEQVQAGAHFPVQWQGPNNSGDMIRVVKTDGTNAGSYAFVGHNPETVILRAPEEPGNYRVVYLTAQQVIGETVFAVAPVTAELDAPQEAEGNLPFNANWQGPGNYGDSIRLIQSETTDQVDYKYIDPDEGNTVVFLAPDVPGEYELHYVTHGGKVLAARAVTITPATLKPGSLQVSAGKKPALGPNDGMEIVLDASGSMLQRQDGERRIDIAKRTLTSLVAETIPEGTPFALRVFGHKEADKCRTDLEIPLAPLNRATVSSRIAGVAAMNLAKTPIADSLAQVSSDLGKVTGERIIVLVTDGEETCDGDPADVIVAMRAAGSDIRVNIVGYAIDDAGLRETFARWASLGGGEYFDVSAEAELASALTSAVNPSFVVNDSNGAVVGRGVAGGTPIELAAGNYQVVAGGREYAAEISPERRSTVTLE